MTDDARLHRFPWPRNRWGEIEPPAWLRHVTPWWLLELIDRHFLPCWLGMAEWKLFGARGWDIGRGCFFPYDYCGKYDQCSRRNRERAMQVWQGRPEVRLTIEEPGDAPR
jgi:hypothetical protein